MTPYELLLSHFDIQIINPEDGRVNHINLGASFNFFAVIKSGYAILTSSDKRVELYPGELLYIPRGLVYTSEWYGEGGCVFYSLPFTFRYLSENSAYTLQKISCDGEGFRGVFDMIYECKTKEPTRSLSLFYELYGRASKKLEKREQSFENSRASEAVRYMEGHVSENFDVPRLARMCGMSESGFYAEFKRLTGHTPIAYKNILRCRAATELLRNTSKTVESIAESVGCTDASYLRRLLVKELKKTPKEIRGERETI
jgi:AraC-like DNA-binding protein